VFDRNTAPLHDDIDVVYRLSFSCNQGAGVSFLQCGMLVYGEANTSGPLNQGVVRVKVEEIAIPAGSRDAENILQRLFIIRACRQ
jgi:hypothetical protein